MSPQDLYSVGGRLLRVYFLASGLSSLPGIFSAYEAALSTSPMNAGTYALSVTAQVLVLICIGALLLLRYRTTSKSCTGSTDSTAILGAGVQLLGLSFALAGLIGMVSWVGEAALVTNWSFGLGRVISHVSYAVIGALLLLRATRITAFLKPAAAA